MKKRKVIPVGVWMLVSGAALFLFAACGTKKNTPLSRQWQAFTTRYNVFHNGKEHYREQLDGMEDKYEDDYTRRLFTHPAEARNNPKSPQPSGDFKRTIEKMQKSIQLHSITKKPTKRGASAKEKEFRSRTEFNPFLHNAWLLMAESQYLNGDFTGAAATFSYIAKNFTWLPEVVTQARIYEALSYAALDWVYEAENALHPVKEKDLTSNNLRLLYSRAKGDILMRGGDYRAALPWLENAARMSSGTQKNRLWFLSGQLHSQIGARDSAYVAFTNAAKGNSIPYRAKFNARIRRSEVYTGKNIEKEVKSLKNMTRFARNKDYADQIWYAIGNLYLAQGDSLQAARSYAEAVKLSTRQGIDKALAQIALGNIYFAEGRYDKAQPCFAEGIPQLSEDYPNYKVLKHRSDVLDELALYAGNVQLQDSLLILSRLSPEEQMKVAKRLAQELIDKERREQEEQDLQQREAQAQNNEANAQQNIKKNDRPAAAMPNSGDRSWYFYNTMTKAQGKTEFQRKWGARKLEDDWRRRNKSSFAVADEDPSTNNAVPDAAKPEELSAETNDKGGSDAKGNDSKNDPHKPEYYLAQIPQTDEERANSMTIVREGLYNMGVILKDKLEDFPKARVEFNRLNTRFPDNEYRLEAYYNLYIMAVREGDKVEAEKWRSLILKDFADSPYGNAMANPNYFDNLRQMNQIQEDIYSRAYANYLANSNDSVHILTRKMEADYPLSKLLPKFVFIDALSYLSEKNNDKFKERLSTLLERWPDTEMTPMAASIMKGLKSGKKPNSEGGNSRGMIWSLALSNDSTATGADSPAKFDSDPNKPHYLVLAFPADSVNVNSLIYEMARFNFSSFLVKDFDMEPMNFGEVGLLIIKGFPNLREVENYRTVMNRNSVKLPEGIVPVMISKDNFELLLREGRSFDEYFRFKMDQSPLPE